MNYIVIPIEVQNVFIGRKFRSYIIIISFHDDLHLIHYSQLNYMKIVLINLLEVISSSLEISLRFVFSRSIYREF